MNIEKINEALQKIKEGLNVGDKHEELKEQIDAQEWAKMERIILRDINGHKEMLGYIKDQNSRDVLIKLSLWAQEIAYLLKSISKSDKGLAPMRDMAFKLERGIHQSIK